MNNDGLGVGTSAGHLIIISWLARAMSRKESSHLAPGQDYPVMLIR